jgi:taurine dioxygenase
MSALLEDIDIGKHTNFARETYRLIEVEPLAGALGAEIGGVDLSEDISDDLFDEIHQAFLDHLVIFFRDQSLTPDQQKAFARRFGELHVNEFIPGIEGHPEIIPIAKEPDDKYNVGHGWHSDVTFAEEPALGSVLYARQIPPHGGDTLFANMYMAYDTLSEGMKDLLDGVTAVHSAGAAFGPQALTSTNADDGSVVEYNYSEETEQRAEHPVFRTHPETGRKALYVNSIFTVGLSRMRKEESDSILSFLYQHLSKPEFQCRFRWRDGSMAMWDNRCAQHYPLNDYHGQRRLLHRVTVLGDKPF